MQLTPDQRSRLQQYVNDGAINLGLRPGDVSARIGVMASILLQMDEDAKPARTNARKPKDGGDGGGGDGETPKN